MANSKKSSSNNNPPRGNGLPPLRNEILQAKMTAGDVIGYNKYILGKILTIVDASITDKEQLKAVKDLIKISFWDAYDIVWRWMNRQIKGEGGTFPLSEGIRNPTAPMSD